MTFKPIICIDFDGVLHSYTSGWQGADVANDLPVPGAIEWLRALVEGDEVDPQIYSSRSKSNGGVLCMHEWLLKHGLEERYADKLKFPTEKPAAFLTIDDRAICFSGVFPTVEAMKGFVPWNKRGKPNPKAQAIIDKVLGFERPKQITANTWPPREDGGAAIVLRTVGNVIIDFTKAEVEEGVPDGLIKARHANAVQALKRFAHPEALTYWQPHHGGEWEGLHDTLVHIKRLNGHHQAGYAGQFIWANGRDAHGQRITHYHVLPVDKED